jgi:hypothetical protein
MRREGKAMGVRTSQTIRYVSNCSQQRSVLNNWNSCKGHSSDILNFVYEELKRLGRNHCKSRLELVEISRKALEWDQPSLRMKGFRCLRTKQLRRARYRVDGKVRRHEKWRRVQEHLQEEMFLLDFLRLE